MTSANSLRLASAKLERTVVQDKQQLGRDSSTYGVVMSFENSFNILIDPDFLLDPNNKDKFTTPEKFTSDVRVGLQEIQKTQSGRILLRSIRWHGRWVRISPPVMPIGGNPLTCRTDEANWGEPKDLQFYRATKPFFDAMGLQFKGIHSVVRFSPNQHRIFGACWIHNVAKSDFQPTPASVLFHELVHAFRHVSKKFDKVTQTHGGIANFDSREEFNAILVQNIYQSELGSNIRQSHHGFNNMDQDLNGSFEFFKVSTKAFQMVDKFCKENKGLTRALSCIKVAFNPLAAYYRDPGKAKRLSASETAVRRDVGTLVNLSGLSWQTWLKLLQAS